eukprot:SAG22_NODE_100_length_20558_cov_10.189305_8_plen_86_part_00
MDSDRLVVMDQGRVAEQGSPSSMLRNQEGWLYKMVHASGEKQASYLTQLAFAHEDGGGGGGGSPSASSSGGSWVDLTQAGEAAAQ